MPNMRVQPFCVSGLLRLQKRPLFPATMHSYIERVNGAAHLAYSQTLKAGKAAENAGPLSKLSEALEKVGSKIEVFMRIGTG